MSRKIIILKIAIDLIKGYGYSYMTCSAGGCERLNIPVMLFHDEPRGVVLGNSTCFPVTMARGASLAPNLKRPLEKPYPREEEVREVIYSLLEYRAACSVGLKLKEVADALAIP